MDKEQTKQKGALVVGGDHPGLGVARSLGRRGIPVYIVEDQPSISAYSKYATKVIRVPNLLDERKVTDAVLEVGQQYGLKDWVLFPTRDETVAAFARYRADLEPFFTVTTPHWETIKWAWDKKNTYDLAEKLNIPCPKTFQAEDEEALKELYQYLPLAIKPAVKENFFYATGAKAWRADTPEQLRDLYLKARVQIPAREILIQEIIPGSGNMQYSYCAFFRDKKAHSSLVARRLRQHPREFGRAATYVESLNMPEVEELAVRFLEAIDYYGLVEVEFKLDPRDGKYKLLDVNARTWGFHSIGGPAGVDFPYLLYADQVGKATQRCRGAAGVGWLRLVTDLPTALSDIFHGDISLGNYWSTLRHTRVESVFSAEDPLPFFAELMLLPYIIIKKYY